MIVAAILGKGVCDSLIYEAVLMCLYAMALLAVHPARLDMLENVPGIDYADQTVTFEATDFTEAYDGIEALLGVAVFGYQRVLQATIESQGKSREIRDAFWESLSRDWVAVESGQWEPPAPTEDDPAKKYFGAQ